MEIVITLYEGHYHYGVAALINSLSNNAFKGIICIGYRGTLPFWISQLKKDNLYFELNKDIQVRFIEVETDLHFGYYKPFFLDNVFEEFPTANKVYYFDPDIVLINNWQFYSDWANAGVSLCLDNCFPYLGKNHPWRYKWYELAGLNELKETNNIDFYVNSGFIGVQRKHRELMDKWKFLTLKYKEIGGDTTQFEKSSERAFKGDQDLLNAAISVSPEIEFSVIGKEGMGFSQPAYLMLHAVAGTKPWKRKFIKDALSGFPPGLAEKGYWNNCSNPLKLYPSSQLKMKKLSIKLASLIGRFYRKN